MQKLLNSLKTLEKKINYFASNFKQTSCWRSLINELFLSLHINTEKKRKYNIIKLFYMKWCN